MSDQVSRETPSGSRACFCSMYSRVTRAVSMMSCFPMANTLMPREYSPLNRATPRSSTKPSSTWAMSPSSRRVPSGQVLSTIFSKSRCT